MAKLGCTVRAFDPNVEEQVQHPNIHFKKLGLSHNNGTLKNTAADGTVRQMPVLTLLDRGVTKLHYHDTYYEDCGRATSIAAQLL